VNNKKTKPIASLSFDLDDKWSYMKTHGDPGWESYPSYLDVVVPRVLSFLAERGLRITFFIVGRDATSPKNADVIRSIAAAGHEIGNHSFSHEPWFHLYSEEQVQDEVERAEEHIAEVTGQRPVGFRGPGYSFTPATLRALTKRRYLYDASSLPTFLGPLARAYYFMVSCLTEEEATQRNALFGSFKDGLRPIRPHRLTSDFGELIEVPVTTMPLLRTPIHFSYILYLSTFSRRAALSYFRAALMLCHFTGTSPSLLLHPLDFLDNNDSPELSFFPAMALSHGIKMEVIGSALSLYSKYYSIATLQEHARNAAMELNEVGRKTPVLDRTRGGEASDARAIRTPD
jgi:peptidoglycan-N-acetylglucosamine deacetylase